MLKKLVLIILLGWLLYGCSAILYKPIKGCAPYYGNWCGLGYPKKGENPPAVDNWDRACRAHDQCYASQVDREKCDRQFVAKLERLSREELVPQRMFGAHSWFETDGFVGGTVLLKDEMWALTASCKGGDGIAANFICVENSQSWCPLDKYQGGGRAGLYCSCTGFPGIIVEN